MIKINPLNFHNKLCKMPNKSCLLLKSSIQNRLESPVQCKNDTNLNCLVFVNFLSVVLLLCYTSNKTKAFNFN